MTLHEYEAALDRIFELALSDPARGTRAALELDALVACVIEHEKNKYPALYTDDPRLVGDSDDQG